MRLEEPPQMTHASPEELRRRAKEHMSQWRELLPTDTRAAQEHRDQAENLALLADEADEAAAKVAE